MSEEKKLITIFIVECKTPDHFFVGMTTESMQEKVTRLSYRPHGTFMQVHGYKRIIWTDVTADKDYASGQVYGKTLELMEKYGLDNVAGGPWSQVHKTVIPIQLRGKVKLAEARSQKVRRVLPDTK